MKVRALHRGLLKDLLARRRAQGLSKNTVRLIRGVLSVLLGDAVDDGIIAMNPALQMGRRRRKRLTYVSAQLGHANPTTTLRHYARWMPKKGKRWVNALDKTARGGRFVEPKSGASDDGG